MAFYFSFILDFSDMVSATMLIGAIAWSGFESFDWLGEM